MIENFILYCGSHFFYPMLSNVEKSGKYYHSKLKEKYCHDLELNGGKRATKIFFPSWTKEKWWIFFLFPSFSIKENALLDFKEFHSQWTDALNIFFIHLSLTYMKLSFILRS